MAIDPRSVERNNVADTCSVWNVLSSPVLYNGSVSAGCHFVISTFVQYECLFKPRTRHSGSDAELQSRLRVAQAKGKFAVQPIDLDDLMNVVLVRNANRFGRGEISSIALAIKAQQAVLTDDQKARRLAGEAGLTQVQTTPHIFAWLIFNRTLTDTDKDLVIAEHRGMGRPLAPHFETAYLLALQYRSAEPN
jgi:predicted nucleic acid-binding protein